MTSSLIVGAGASGCSCGADIDTDGGLPELCVSEEGSAACDLDGSELDWGAPPAGAITTLVLRVSNKTAKGTPLRIDEIRVTDDFGAARLFDIVLCQPTCDVQRLGLPASIAPGASAQLVLSFDAQVDGEVPAESLEIISNTAVDDVAPKGTYVRSFAGVIDGCLEGRTDANQDKSDGCECAPTVDGLEACDGLDNDCDGEIDEDVPDTGIACDTGLTGSCGPGTVGCVDGGLACVPSVATTAEVCDGLDNDCDGETDEENSWFSFNEGLSGGNMSLVAYDTRVTDVAYAVTGNRVYRSNDNGATFGLVGSSPHPITALGFPVDPAQILAASYGGLLRSEDGGVTWEQVSLSSFPIVSILVHPADPGRIYVGTIGGGIYLSTNGGQGFSAVNQGVPYSRVASLVGHPSDPDIVIAGLQLLNDQSGINFQGEILQTTNGGANWTIVETGVGAVRRVAACPTDGDVLYAASYNTGVLQSLDGGASWMVVGLAGQQVNGLAVAPSDCMGIYAATEVGGLFHSDDGGAVFDGPYLDGLDIQRPGATELSVAPQAPARVLLSNHSGVFLSSDAAVNWSRVPSIEGAIVRALTVSAADPSTVWLSSWGQGQWLRAGVADQWERVPASEIPRDWVSTNTPDPADPSRVTVGAVGDIWQTLDTGETFTAAPGPANPMAIAYHPVDEAIIYVATQLGGVWKSSDAGQTYVQMNSGLPDPWPTGPCVCRDVRAILVDSAAPETVYIGTTAQGVFKSVDGGASWATTAPALAGESIRCLVQQGNGDVLACVAGKGIWRSTDSAQTFTKITQSLVELNNVGSIFIDPSTSDIYAASDGAILRSSDSGVTWDDMDSLCLPAGAGTPVIMEDGAQRLLLAGTGGVGVFALSLSP